MERAGDKERRILRRRIIGTFIQIIPWGTVRGALVNCNYTLGVVKETVKKNTVTLNTWESI